MAKLSHLDFTPYLQGQVSQYLHLRFTMGNIWVAMRMACLSCHKCVTDIQKRLIHFLKYWTVKNRTVQPASSYIVEISHQDSHLLMYKVMRLHCGMTSDTLVVFMKTLPKWAFNKSETSLSSEQ